MSLSNDALRDALGQRLTAVEVQQRHVVERLGEDRQRAAEDRAEMKQQLTEAREDIAELRKELAAVTAAWQSALDQIKGGKRALHALYVVGGALVALGAWGSGLLKWLAGLPIR